MKHTPDRWTPAAEEESQNHQRSPRAQGEGVQSLIREVVAEVFSQQGEAQVRHRNR